MDNIYDSSKKWVYYLTRPFNLFGTSVWQAWYESRYIEELFSDKVTDVLCIEEARNQIRQYRTRKQILHFGRKFLSLQIFRRKFYKDLLQQAVIINNQAKKILQQGQSPFFTLEDTMDFLTKLALYGTLLPNFPSFLVPWKGTMKGEIGGLIKELRSISYYPSFYEKILVPVALERMKSLGVFQDSETLSLVTIKELLKGNIQAELVELRKNCVKDGKYFIYQQIGELESVHWIQNPLGVILKLEQKLFSGATSQIKGQAASPGRVQGKIRIVRDYDLDKDKFEQGEILVAVSTNPSMLPLMKRARAIITDEGGLTCHAAIISREFKIPCIIGTKIATKVFKDGDMVEVDADKGVVRKL